MSENQQNPYLVKGPALVSFSGGRTSAYMVKKILEAHKGTLPQDVQVVFANTGRERNETLDFVSECERRWGVKITWVEWRDERYFGAKYEIVSYKNASRSGEPFELLIDRKKCLPSPMRRFCTQELKLKPMAEYARKWLGWSSWIEVVGLRGDEPGRVVRATGTASDNSRQIVCPLFHANVTEKDVKRFWSQQEFDLQLRSYQGNCDLCFLKGAGKLSQIMQERPDLADWWIRQENKIKHTKKSGEFLKFRDDRSEDYETMLDYTQRQGVLPFNIFDDRQDCEIGCTDQEPYEDLRELTGGGKTNE